VLHDLQGIIQLVEVIRGIQETQEMLDFAGKHNVTAMIEKIPMPYVNTAMEQLEKECQILFRH
jgi:D-arabinose 1-dehydrogenase-like Zn-dependent alcohol dehydrogenase